MLKIDWHHCRKSPNTVGFHFTEQVLRKVVAEGKRAISLHLKKASLYSKFKLLRGVPSWGSQHHALVGPEEGVVGEVGDFCCPRRSTL